MKRVYEILVILAMAFLTACAAPAGQPVGDATAIVSTQPGSTTAQTAINAVQTANELKALIEQYKSEENYEAVY